MKPNKSIKLSFPISEHGAALDEHIRRLRPSVSPNPKKKHISATRATATAINSRMNQLRTVLQVNRSSIGGDTVDIDLS